MKFGKRFREEMIPEWQDFYVSYKKLKAAIDAASKDSNNRDLAEQMMETMRSELQKAEEHFLELLRELTDSYNALLALYNPAGAEGDEPMLTRSFSRSGEHANSFARSGGSTVLVRRGPKASSGSDSSPP